MANFQDLITQRWVKITGRKIDPVEYSWLIGPVGDVDIIGDKFIDELAKTENLEITRNASGSGLISSVEDMGITGGEKQRLNDMVADFYENTSAYNFEIWSEWKGFFKPFGGLLSVLFSKRLQQLNLPLSSMESAKGLNSEIIQLKHSNHPKPKWTIWYRKLKSSGDVIYTGIYTTCNNPNYNHPLLKVIFPLPNGNASVIMTKTVMKDGSLFLSSDGKKFGDNGFYFTLTNHKGKYWAKFIKAMHEWIRVYVDDEDVLRADHELNFYGFNFLKLHYKMAKKVSAGKKATEPFIPHQ